MQSARPAASTALLSSRPARLCQPLGASRALRGALSALALVGLLAGCTPAPTAPSAEPLPPGAVLIGLTNPSFAGDATGQLTGWTAKEHNRGKSYSFIADTAAPLSGPSSGRIQRYGDEIFGLVDQRIVVKPEWIGKTARLSGYLRTEGVTGTGGALVIQARNGSDNVIAHDHMDARRATGTQGWKRHTVEVKVAPGSYWLQVGAMLEESGTLWVDDLSLVLLDAAPGKTPPPGK